MKRVLTLLVALFSGASAFATAQSPDKIIYEGKEYALYSNPLEPYFTKNPEKRPRPQIMSSALWRGYVATFEIKDKQLFLKDIEIQYSDSVSAGAYKFRSVMQDVFPGQQEVKIGWITGLLVLPHGERVNYVHMGYGSTYEKYILLEIDKGDLKNAKRLKHKEYEKFKERQFQAFKKTDEYKTLKEDLHKKGYSEDLIDSFLKSFVTDYTSMILTD
jgi:hypothetical protein